MILINICDVSQIKFMSTVLNDKWFVAFHNQRTSLVNKGLGNTFHSQIENVINFPIRPLEMNRVGKSTFLTSGKHSEPEWLF